MRTEGEAKAPHLQTCNVPHVHRCEAALARRFEGLSSLRPAASIQRNFGLHWRRVDCVACQPHRLIDLVPPKLGLRWKRPISRTWLCLSFMYFFRCPPRGACPNAGRVPKILKNFRANSFLSLIFNFNRGGGSISSINAQKIFPVVMCAEIPPHQACRASWPYAKGQIHGERLTAGPSCWSHAIARLSSGQSRGLLLP